MVIEGDQAGEIVRKSAEDLDGKKNNYAVKIIEQGPSGYISHFLDEAGDIDYIGKMKLNGLWLIIKISVSGQSSSITYANLSNNSSYNNLIDAWNNKENLTYSTINNLSNI